MKNILQNKKLIFLILISIISLVYLLFAKTPTSQNPPQEIFSPTPSPISNIKSSQPAFTNLRKYQVVFDPKIDWSIFPKNLKIYNSSPNPEDINKIVQKFAVDYNLVPDNKYSNLWVSKNSEFRLNINYKSQYFVMDQTYKNSLYSQKYSYNQALNAADNIIFKYFKNQSLLLDSKNVKYTFATKKQTEWIDTAPDKANLIGLKYYQSIDNYPFYSNNQVNPPLTLTFGPENRLYKIMYISQPLPNLTTSEEKPLLSLDVVKKYLSEGQGEILALNFIDLDPKSNTIPPMTVTQANIEYRQDLTNNKVIPYFRFIATFQSEYSHESLPVIIILPAVNL